MAQRHGGFHQQAFREQAVTGFGGALDRLVRHKGFCPLHPADKQRRGAVNLAQRKGHLCQHRLLCVAKRQRGFALFIQKSIGAQAQGKLLLVFAGQGQQRHPFPGEIAVHQRGRKLALHCLIVPVQRLQGLLTVDGNGQPRAVQAAGKPRLNLQQLQ